MEMNLHIQDVPNGGIIAIRNIPTCAESYAVYYKDKKEAITELTKDIIGIVSDLPPANYQQHESEEMWNWIKNFREKLKLVCDATK